MTIVPEQTFVCVECGAPVTRFAGDTDEFALCAICLFLPGWTSDPQLRRIFGRGTEPEERKTR